jgi:2-polyprenyl-3-methyl-5-hydroxy-6-metoxy-1,4-benzoquinol methylase
MGTESADQITKARIDWWDRFWSTRAHEQPSTDESESWERLVWSVALEFWEELFGQLAPGKEMLECGSGTARVSEHLARKGYTCTMLDYSETGLKLGRTRFTGAGLGGHFLRGDVNEMSFGDSTFDIVYSGGMLEFFSDIRSPINEMVRVLRPGGVFGAAMVPRKWSVQTVADIERTALRSAKRLLTGRVGEAFQVVRGVPKEYGVNQARLEDYVRACEDAGLVSVTGLGTSPFPSLALPRRGRAVYAKALTRLRPMWNRFDRSQSRWTESIGIAYRVYGVKPI